MESTGSSTPPAPAKAPPREQEQRQPRAAGAPQKRRRNKTGPTPQRETEPLAGRSTRRAAQRTPAPLTKAHALPATGGRKQLQRNCAAGRASPRPPRAPRERITRRSAEQGSRQMKAQAVGGTHRPPSAPKWQSRVRNRLPRPQESPPPCPGPTHTLRGSQPNRAAHSAAGPPRPPAKRPHRCAHAAAPSARRRLPGAPPPLTAAWWAAAAFAAAARIGHRVGISHRAQSGPVGPFKGPPVCMPRETSRSISRAPPSVTIGPAARMPPANDRQILKEEALRGGERQARAPGVAAPARGLVHGAPARAAAPAPRAGAAARLRGSSMKAACGIEALSPARPRAPMSSARGGPTAPVSGGGRGAWWARCSATAARGFALLFY